MRLTFASKVVCLPPYEMLQAPQAEEQQFFLWGNEELAGEELVHTIAGRDELVSQWFPSDCTSASVYCLVFISTD